MIIPANLLDVAFKQHEYLNSFDSVTSKTLHLVKSWYDLFVKMTDFETWMTLHFELERDKNDEHEIFDCLVDAQLTKLILSQLTNDVEITRNDNKLLIKSNNDTFTINLPIQEKINMVIDDFCNDLMLSYEDLIIWTQHVLEAVPIKDLSPQLCCVSIKRTNNVLEIVWSDWYFLSIYRVDNQWPDFQALIPRRQVMAMKYFMQMDTRFWTDKNNIIFFAEREKEKFATMLMKRPYNDYNPIVNKPFDVVATLNDQIIKTIIKKTRPFWEMITMKIDNGSVTVSVADNKNKVSIESVIQWWSWNATITFKRSFLPKIVKYFVWDIIIKKCDKFVMFTKQHSSVSHIFLSN